MKKYRIRRGSYLWHLKNALTSHWMLVFIGAVIIVAGAMPAPEEIIAPPAVEPQEETYIIEGMKELGEYTVTAYCPCEICCGKWSNPDNPKTASGTTAKAGRTIGTDWNTLPPGSRIMIDGTGTYTVEDKVAGWIADRYDGKIIDLYFDTHAEAVAFGKQTLKIWKVGDTECSTD